MAFQRLKPYNDLPPLTSLCINFESPAVMRQLVRASRSLAELKGFCRGLPDIHLFMDALMLRDARDNVAIGSDPVDIGCVFEATSAGFSAGEAVMSIVNCVNGVHLCYERISGPRNLILQDDLAATAEAVTGQGPVWRTDGNCGVKNAVNGEIIYTPPAGPEVIREKIDELERFINNSRLSSFDPLIKLALIHYQFLAIHPFGEANGRVSRILNAVHLVQQDLIDQPLLTLSGFFRKNGSRYFALLGSVTREKAWIEWVLFVLTGVHECAIRMLDLLKSMQELRMQLEEKMRSALTSYYSEDLLRLMFKCPFFRIEALDARNTLKEKTAAYLLKVLVDSKLVTVRKINGLRYFENQPFLRLMIGK